MQRTDQTQQQLESIIPVTSHTSQLGPNGLLYNNPTANMHQPVTTAQITGTKRIRSNHEDEDEEDDNEASSSSLSPPQVDNKSAVDVAVTKKPSPTNSDEYEDYSSDNETTMNNNSQNVANNRNVASENTTSQTGGQNHIDNITSESESASNSSASSASSSDCEENGGVDMVEKPCHSATTAMIIESRAKSSSIPIGDPALVKQSQQFLASFQQQQQLQLQHHHTTNHHQQQEGVSNQQNQLTQSSPFYQMANKPPTHPNSYSIYTASTHHHIPHHHFNSHQYAAPASSHHDATSSGAAAPAPQHPHQNLMSVMFNKMQDAVANSPLLRTCSNASSTSTSSSISSSSISDHHNESSGSLGASASPSSVEGHLKALIMSVAAAANGGGRATGGERQPASTDSSSPSFSSSSSTSDDPSAVAAVAAAFADQVAFMVRSRSSSLSDCSSTSSSMCVSTSSQSSSTSSFDKDAALNGESTSNSTEQLFQALKSSTIMKQMLSSYQAMRDQMTNSASVVAAAASNNPPSNAIGCSSNSINSGLVKSAAVDISKPQVLATTTSATPTNTPSQHLCESPKSLNSSEMSRKLLNGAGESLKSDLSKLGESKPISTTVANISSSQPTPPQGVMSPGTTPCKVCGDEASGFHYGVDSCEGCKGFFRRCITQGMNHQCTNQQQCEMTPFSRNSCQFCRLKKCFAVGMSREASRLGRRPKRPKDDKDMSFESMLMPSPAPATATNQSSPMTSTTPLKSASTPMESSPSQALVKPVDDESMKPIKVKKEKSLQPPFKLASDSPSSSPDKQPQRQPTETTPTLLLPVQTPDLYNQTNSHDLIAHTLSAPKSNTNPQPQTITPMPTPTSREPQQQQQPQDQRSAARERENMHQIEMLSKLISIADKHTSIERTNELELVRTILIEAHAQFWPTTMEKIRRRYAERPPVRVHGADSSRYRECFVHAMVPLIMQVVNFCKKIPGFEFIAQPDQVQLLKQGSFEVICVNSFLLVDAQNRLMLTPDMEFLMDSNTIRSLPLGLFMSEVFELGIQASPLKLTDAEIAIYNAVLIMNPDRGDLQDKDRIEELQETLLHVLYKHLKRYRSDSIGLFQKLIQLMPSIREINRRHSETLSTVRMTTQPSTQQPAANQQRTQ